MLTSAFKVMIRGLFKDKLFALINVIGLTVGLTVFFVIALFVVEEYSYDTFHTKIDRIAKLGMKGSVTGPIVFNPIAKNLHTELDEIEASSRYGIQPKTVVEWNDVRFHEEEIAKVDSDFFKIFSFGQINGSGSTVLTSSSNVVITQSIKQKYFGEQDAIGEVLKIDGNPYMVSEVLPDIPKNSSLQFSILLPIKTEDYDGWYLPTDGYCLLSDKITHGNWAERLTNTKVSAFGLPEKVNDQYQLTTMPFAEVHLKEESTTSKANSFYVLVFSAIGVLVLLIACINYVNLAIAKSFKRMKEASIRKTLGAGKTDLLLYFLSETLVFSLLSCIIAFALVERLGRYFESITQRELINYDQLAYIPLFLFAISLIMGFLSGYFPALKLTRALPVRILGTSRKSAIGGRFRSVLLGFQFVTSLSLILLTLVVGYQLNYLKTTDRGFETEARLAIKLPASVKDRSGVLKNKLLALGGVQGVSLTEWVPGAYYKTGLLGKHVDRFLGDPDERLMLNYSLADRDFMGIMGIGLLSGTWFSDASTASSKEVLINESMAIMIEGTDPLGARIVDNNDTLKVIGVVADLITESLKLPVEPALFRLGNRDAWSYTLVSMDHDESGEQIADINKVWNEIFPEYPLDSYFLESRIEETHLEESNLNTLFVGFSTVSIIICILGLLGLSAYIQETRSKEFSIHKVLGAGVSSLMNLAFASYVRIIFISLLIAIPIAYYLGNQWLQSFFYRFDFRLIDFTWPLLVMIAMSLAVSLVYILKLIRVNPAETLKSE